MEVERLDGRGQTAGTRFYVGISNPERRHTLFTTDGARRSAGTRFLRMTEGLDVLKISKPPQSYVNNVGNMVEDTDTSKTRATDYA